ncbi:MAG: thioredoxin domain-containing protein [Nitrospinae bacterium]|nr:thioredoxin domain-containing protein [Nitrospinota bacterium]
MPLTPSRILTILALAFFSVASMAQAADRAEVEAIIRDYIKKHPEEIAEALQKHMESQRARQEEAAFQQALRDRVSVPLEGSPSLGPDKAQFTIVEFSDFQCPFCARAVGIIHDLVSKHRGKIRLVFKQLPLPMHAKAQDAAKASLAANAQGKFWEYREKLMATQAEWGPAPNARALFLKYAREMAMDVNRFEKDMAKPEFQKRIDADMQLAKKLNVNGTPAYFVNGVKITGARELEYFEKVMNAVGATPGGQPRK